MVVSVIESIISHLPETMDLDDGTTVSIYWHPSGEKVPEAQAEANPVIGLVSIGATGPRGNSRNPGGWELVLEEDTDVIQFNTGTLTYSVEQQDIDTVTSIDGFVSAAPHTFVEDTDYTFDAGNIIWLTGGTLPDDASNFTVVYDHKLYQRMAHMWRNVVVRLMLRVKSWKSGTRTWPKSVLAEVIGGKIEDYIRAETGKPVPFNAGESDGLMISRVLSGGRTMFDEGFSVNIWNIDFRVKQSSCHPIGVPVPLVLALQTDPIGLL